MQNRDRSEKGFALLTMMLMMVMLSAFSLGLINIVHSEANNVGSELDGMQTLYAAAAAMEKMVVDLRNLYEGQLSPAASAIEALGAATYHPSLPNVTYPQYEFVVLKTGDVPDSEYRSIRNGPYQGLVADMSTITLRTTATAGGSSTSMERKVNLALIPAFQFGVFSHGELTYSSNGLIEMGARVHANGNLFLAAGSSKDLVFQSRVSSAQEIIRAEIANGISTTSTGWTNPVKIPTAPNGCAGSQPACRTLALAEGSKTAGPTSTDNDNWTSLSETTYNGMVLNDDTGAKPLNLSFVGGGIRPIELVRRPLPGETATSLLGESRLYNQAQVRVLISDNISELPGGSGVRLANLAPYVTAGPVYGATDTAFAEANEPWDADFIRPAGAPAGPWSLIDGYLLVQSRRSDSSYVDVTLEFLNLGIARENPDAILKFQTIKDDNGNGTPDYTFAPSDVSSKFLPIGLYDTREGEVRDVDLGEPNTSCAIGGIISIVELDVGNLKRWLEGNIGSTGTLTESSSQNGYLLYHSDRRGNLPNADSIKVGEYGFEDTINPPSASGTPDGVLAPSEDVNQNGTLDTYGGANLGDAFGVANGDPTIRINCNTVGRKNRVSGARRGLKLVNASLGNVPTLSDGSGGFTVASENIVYVQGNYNANDSGFQNPHAAAAVIADTVSFLSKGWEDWRSFRYPTHENQRDADTTYYRVAVAAGKPLNWPNPSWTSDHDYGLDGGTHNFLRYLEDWGGRTFYYKGSLVSPFNSEYGTGIYKCCNTVYSPPSRDYSFDTDYLDPTKLPPATPHFRDVVTSAHRQVY